MRKTNSNSHELNIYFHLTKGYWGGKFETPPPSPPLEGRGDSAQPSNETLHRNLPSLESRGYYLDGSETQHGLPAPQGEGMGVGSQTSSPFVPMFKGIHPWLSEESV